MLGVKQLQSSDVEGLCLFHAASFLCTHDLFIERLKIQFENFYGQVGRMIGSGFLLNGDLYVVNENLDSRCGVEIHLDVEDKIRWEEMIIHLSAFIGLNLSMVHMDREFF